MVCRAGPSSRRGPAADVVAPRRGAEDGTFDPSAREREGDDVIQAETYGKKRESMDSEDSR